MIPAINHDREQEEAELHGCPTIHEVLEELMAIGKISGPMAITSLLLYSRAFVSMLFLGYLGKLELAAGSLSLGFTNITGYSIISGLAMGMEPICGQAYGAKHWTLLTVTLQRTILLLLSVSLPISVLWINARTILRFFGQDDRISAMAHTFIVSSIPDLFLLSILHPVRIYLRAQNITLPLAYCSAISLVLHVPLNFLLVVYFRMGIAGVAIAMVWTNFNILLLLFLFVKCGIRKDGDLRGGWRNLLGFAIQTCVSVCLEWWWYEVMILLCGILLNPEAAVSAMGILIQTTSLIYVFPCSLGLGASIRISNELGAGRPTRARTAMMVSLVLGTLLGVTALGFAALWRRRWGRFFTGDKDILELTAAALPILGLCELGNCPQTTGCGVLRGSARPATGANINLVAFYGVGMPVAVALGFFTKMGFLGMWMGLMAAQGSCAVIMVWVVWKTDWGVQAERAKALTEKVWWCGGGDDDVEKLLLWHST